ncbi:hypothetical protein B566_EDAN016309 [Ephemera danica]|nr:hypothetical protein B566_EDAN016309 [Ephemera danica]
MEGKNIPQVLEQMDDGALWLKQFQESLQKDNFDDDSPRPEQEENEEDKIITTFESLNSKPVNIGLSSAIFAEQWRNLFSGHSNGIELKEPGNSLLVPVKCKTKGTNIVPFEEVAISIQVNKPFNFYLRSTMKAHVPHVQDEVKVLGCHTLDVLRDVITCPNHFVESAHYQRTIEGQKYIKDIYTSGMFFIENKFYIDTRKPSNKDYSAVIRDWAATNKRCEDVKWSTAKMETTHFQDLTVVFGRPYLYQHLGNCEHIITFVNCSLINRSDIHNIAAYPLTKVPDPHVNLCIMCDFFEATWITFNNTRVTANPAYFCESCYTLYNFKDGNKIGNFSAVPIPKHDVSHKRRKTSTPYSFKVELESKFTKKARKEYTSVSQDTNSTCDQSSTNSPESHASNAILSP